MTDDIIITPSEEVKGMLALMASKQKIHKPAQVILNSDAEGFLRLRDYLDIMGVGGRVRDIILGQKADAGLSRAVATEDLLLRLNMIADPDAELVDYVDLDDVEETKS